MSGKSEGAFRTIGEVADALDLPQHVLRFWETRFKEIEPVKRAGGRRYYRPRDVELVAAIRHLLYGEGYTIKGVQRILKEQGARAVIESARGAEPLGFPVGEARPRADADEPPLFLDADAKGAPRPKDGELMIEDADAPVASAPPAPDIWRPASGLDPARGAQATMTAGSTPPPVHAGAGRPGLGLGDIRHLRAALGEIAECRRLLGLTRR